MKVSNLLLFVFLYLVPFSSAAQDSCQLTYKKVDTVTLKMWVYYPERFKTDQKRTAIVFFYGGGWIGGKISQFEPYAKHYVAKGMVAFLVDYRVRSRQGTTPFEALKDAKTAMRYVRKNAHNFGIDPDKIIASGGSAGGHLAAACFTNITLNEQSDDLKISPQPNALLLFNPVIDNSKEGYGYDRIGQRYREFSPLQNIKKGFPPTAFFLGTHDKLIPVATGELFKKKVDSVGSHCLLFLYEDQQHGFFNQKSLQKDIFLKADAFLKESGFL